LNSWPREWRRLLIQSQPGFPLSSSNERPPPPPPPPPVVARLSDRGGGRPQGGALWSRAREREAGPEAAPGHWLRSGRDQGPHWLRSQATAASVWRQWVAEGLRTLVGLFSPLKDLCQRACTLNPCLCYKKNPLNMYHIMNLEKKGEILCKVSLHFSNYLNALNRILYVNDK